VLGLPRNEVLERAMQALDSVNLDPTSRRPVRAMSGGEQQRVALARALAGQPEVLLADEPTGNLDPALTRDVLDELVAIQKRGNTILLATHDPIVREHVKATRELHLENGRLIDNVITPHLRAITDPEIEVEMPDEPASVASIEVVA